MSQEQQEVKAGIYPKLGSTMEPPRQAAVHSSMWLFKEVFQIWGAQSLLFVFIFSKVSQQCHDFVFKYFWGWFCFCKRGMGRKNDVS